MHKHECFYKDPVTLITTINIPTTMIMMMGMMTMGMMMMIMRMMMLMSRPDPKNNETMNKTGGPQTPDLGATIRGVIFNIRFVG